jgi:hypothetical protein
MCAQPDRSSSVRAVTVSARFAIPTPRRPRLPPSRGELRQSTCGKTAAHHKEIHVKRTLKTTLIGAALALALSSPLMAKDISSVQEARQELAQGIASMVNDQAFDAAVRKELSKGKASLGDVLRAYDESGAQVGGHLTADLRDLERQAIRMRGLTGTLDALFDLRVHGVGKGELTSIRDFWSATVTRNPATGEKLVVAYDTAGQEHRFSLETVPDVPMLIVESDSAAAIHAGTIVMNEVLRSKGMQSGTNRASTLRATSDTEQLTLLKSIYLEKDHEPNIQGDAEIFAIVSGVGPDGKAQLVTKDMPWLDHDKRWYKPGMDLINWTEYGTNYVNVQFFEEDGDTNFKDLALAVIKAVGSLSLVVAPEAPPALIVAGVSKVAEEILKAMDSKWFTNDADYVDSFYVIERGGKYGSDASPLEGARGEAKMVLAPYEVKGR